MDGLSHVNRARRHERRWTQLCARYLPEAPTDSVWRYSRRRKQHEPEQGWKFHISATILNAVVTLKRIAPILIQHDIQFKAPASLRELAKINSGLLYGYSQVGKTITVYPRSRAEALSVARCLHELTRDLSSPEVPFDQKYRPRTSVYYRYGAFTKLEIEHPDRIRVPAVRDPEGNLVLDSRESVAAKPEWVANLLPASRVHRNKNAKVESLLSTRFRVFRALSQRGKGGVYQAIDLGADPPRLCLLKEGRKNGETRWDGRDGAWLARNEERVLSLLRARGVEVPCIYSSFEVDGNYYLVTEFIDGESLQQLLCKRRRRLSLSRALEYGIQLSKFFTALHGAGWIWRDCKPMNIIVTREGVLRPLDFEGACLATQPDPLPWGTQGFRPPESLDGRHQSGLPEDRYALGALLYLLLTGRIPETIGHTPLQKLRRNVPVKIRELVSGLLSSDPARRSSTKIVTSELGEALTALRDSHTAVTRKWVV